MSYYGNTILGRALDRPVGTITSRDRWAIVDGERSGLLRKAKLAHREPYQLRHSYPSLMLMTGVHPAYLAKQLGHKDGEMIRKVYAKWVDKENPGYRNEIAERLGQLAPIRPHEKGA